MSREFSATVTNGTLPEGTWQAIRCLLKGMDGKRVVLTLKEAQRPRSNPQNRWYWGVCVPAVTAMFREAGNYVDDEDVHEYLKQHVGKLNRVIVLPNQEVVRTVGSTAKLSTKEFSDYCERIIAWASEFGVSIPLPGEY